MPQRDYYDVLDLAIKLLGLFGGAIAFWVGLKQYKKGQNWQKAQIILSLIDIFEKDDKIQYACRMLDWDKRNIQINEGRVLAYENSMLVSALKVHFTDSASSDSRQIGFTSDESFIRDCFDAFFDYFQKLYTFKQNELVDFKDLRYFYYWLELVNNIAYYKGSTEIKGHIMEYIEKYKFVGFHELLNEYAKHPDPLLLPEALKKNTR